MKYNLPSNMIESLQILSIPHDIYLKGSRYLGALGARRCSLDIYVKMHVLHFRMIVTKMADIPKISFLYLLNNLFCRKFGAKSWLPENLAFFCTHRPHLFFKLSTAILKCIGPFFKISKFSIPLKYIFYILVHNSYYFIHLRGEEY